MAVAAVSLLSKYVIRAGGRPLFNPSNIGLLACFLILGSRRTEPLDFWWVRPGVGLTIALSLIVVGGVLLALRVGVLGVVTSFWVTYAAALGILAWRGHCITARWHIGAVCNGYFWSVLVVSPELLVFAFFMITDPKTIPSGRIARRVYGAAIALVFVALAAPQRTEFATKVALLASLAIVCAARPVLERLFTADFTWLRNVERRKLRRRVGAVAVSSLAYVAIIVGAGAPASSFSAPASASATAARCSSSTAVSTTPTRPQVAASGLPTVHVHNAVDVATPIGTSTARKIVRDVVDDLAIAAQAVEHRTPEVVDKVARFPWYSSLLATICANDPEFGVSTYRVTAATVTVAKRRSGQVFPEIDVDLRGRRTYTTYRRAGAPHVLHVSTSPFHEVYVVARSSTSWLVCGARTDPRTAACITAL